jgi:very-short-patch-repair endonuclease
MSAIALALIGLIGLISLPIVLIRLIARGRKSPTNTRRFLGSHPTSAPPRVNPRSAYERVPTLLTAAERDFFAALQQATPTGHLIFAQVRLANLIQVKHEARRDKSHWWRIQAKCLDFVLVDSATFVPRLVVELDDSSHHRADRRERDAFVDEVLAAVGIPILHVPWQRNYNIQALAALLASRLGIATLAPAHAPVPQAVPAASNGFWSPIPIAPVPAAAPTVASNIAPAPSAASRYACGQCQAELHEGARFCAQCGAVFAFG